MKTILIASLLAFSTDPTGAPSCEDELLVCEDELAVCEDEQALSSDLLDAVLVWSLSLTRTTGGATGGGTATEPTIGEIADRCRLFGAPDLDYCVQKTCSNLPSNCL